MEQRGTDRRGDWMLTHSGRKVYPLDPRPDDISIEDIARSLSNKCRFGGHCRQFYSVAQHSIFVMSYVEEVDPGLMLAALLHDAAEAYLGDIIRPLKRGGVLTPVWYEAEEMWNTLLAASFRIKQEDFHHNPIIEEADCRVLLAERRDIMAQSPDVWRESADGHKPWPERFQIFPWSPEQSYREFMAAFQKQVVARA